MTCSFLCSYAKHLLGMLAILLESIVVIEGSFWIVGRFFVVFGILFALFRRNFDESEFTFIIKTRIEFACWLEYDAYLCALSCYILFLLTALAADFQLESSQTCYLYDIAIEQFIDNSLRKPENTLDIPSHHKNKLCFYYS